MRIFYLLFTLFASANACWFQSRKGAVNHLILLALFYSIPAVFSIAACDKELKEHPMSSSLKRQMEMQNDPEIQAKKVTGIIKLSPDLSDKTSKNASLFIIARAGRLKKMNYFLFSFLPRPGRPAGAGARNKMFFEI